MPTVYRVVMTLTAEGYLDHLPNGDYRPGVRTLTLGTAALRSLDLVGDRDAASCSSSARRTGETVNLAVLTGDRVLYLVRLRNSDLVTANIQVGSTLPAVHTSIGKLLLAHLDEADLRERGSPPSRSPPSTVPTPRSRWTSCATSSPRSASRAGPCRTRSWPTGCARWPGRSPSPDGRVVAGVNLAVAGPGLVDPADRARAQAGRARRPAPRSPRCCPTAAPDP